MDIVSKDKDYPIAIYYITFNNLALSTIIAAILSKYTKIDLFLRGLLKAIAKGVVSKLGLTSLSPKTYAYKKVYNYVLKKVRS